VKILTDLKAIVVNFYASKRVWELETEVSKEFSKLLKPLLELLRENDSEVFLLLVELG